MSARKGERSDSQEDEESGESAAEETAEAVEHSRPFQWLVRTGFAARALTYAVIAGLTLAMAFGAGTMGAAPSQQGALSLLARDWLGEVALVVVAAGLLAYAAWKLVQGFQGHGPEGGGGATLKERVGNLGAGVGYIVFFLVAVRTLMGSGGNGSAAPSQDTAGVLGWPGGQFLVAGVGVVTVAISLGQAYLGVTDSFTSQDKTAQMGPAQRKWFCWLGRVGLTARAVVFILVGYFLIRAAIDFDPAQAVSLDGALARVGQAPYGPWLLGGIAAGLLTFATFSAFESRYRQL